MLGENLQIQQLSINQYYFRLIKSLIVKIIAFSVTYFLALYSALGSWLMAKRRRPDPHGPKERQAWDMAWDALRAPGAALAPLGHEP